MFRHHSVSAPSDIRFFSASSTVRSLRSVTCLRRADGAYSETGKIVDDRRKERAAKKHEKATPPGRFTIGFAPLTNITEYDAQISGG
ncbi:hypothetical protein GAT01_23055, partial [Salmonella enterica]|nr:hypothetical protein [Salmonella enterica]